ncbi:uncharacterized protein DS421_1g14110 [Arachis hypogaea]|nr:uncharacterized protein DS421_1g14110 [Arachis hypogaea]
MPSSFLPPPSRESQEEKGAAAMSLPSEKLPLRQLLSLPSFLSPPKLCVAVMTTENHRWNPCLLGLSSGSCMLRFMVGACDIKLLRHYRSCRCSIFSVIRSSFSHCML